MLDLDRLYGGSFVGWEGVAASWAKRTISSRMLVFAARRYLAGRTEPPDVAEIPDIAVLRALPPEVAGALASPPEVSGDGEWGEFLDAALAAELEMLPYGERPPVISQLREGFGRAEAQATDGETGRWFADRREALPGFDLPDGAGFLPV